jgi:hypothetical protein
MEKISIFNYEAYYLDYLEGNLNEEDTALLLAFLEANPDLKLEDDVLEVNLEPEFAALDSKSKATLFQYDNEDALTAENVEFFMIAAKEGVLDSAKKEELLTYLEGHPGLQNDWRIYQQTQLEPNLALQYTDKEALKQKTRVLWPYISFAAAASVAALIMFWPVGNSQGTEGGLGYLAGNVRTGASMSFFDFHGRANGADPNGNQGMPIGVDNGMPNNTMEQYVAQGNPQQTKSQKTVNGLEYRPAGNVISIFNDLELQPIAKTVFEGSQNTNGNVLENGTQDMADARSLEMRNPIEPITKFVGEKTNTDIDFRKTEKGAEGNKGFYLKIGKFEISRKKH